MTIVWVTINNQGPEDITLKSPRISSIIGLVKKAMKLTVVDPVVILHNDVKLSPDGSIPVTSVNNPLLVLTTVGKVLTMRP